MEQNGRVVTMGAVLFSPRCTGPQYFGGIIPDAFIREWNSGGSVHVVSQAELLPIVSVRLTFEALLVHAWVIYFIDNDGVKAALVNGNTKCLASMKLLALAARLEMSTRSNSWYTRVPSPSNIADAPSRLDYTVLQSIQNSRFVEPILPDEVM